MAVERLMAFSPFAFAAMMLTMLVVAACSDQHSPPPAASDFPPGILAELQREARGDEAEVLADGKLTFPEYEKSVLATVDCLNGIGSTGVSATLSSSGTRYHLRFSVPADDNEAMIRADECLANHLNAVESAWQFLHRPTETQLTTARQALIACLEGAGIDVPDEPAPALFVSLAQIPEYQKCTTDIQSQFDVPGFGG